jgi:hypothetical protein
MLFTTLNVKCSVTYELTLSDKFNSKLDSKSDNKTQLVFNSLNNKSYIIFSVI